MPRKMPVNGASNHKSFLKKDYRQGPDIINKLINLLSISLWIFIIFNLCIVFLAKPVGETFFDRFFNVTVRSYWDANLLSFALILSLVQFIVSIFSLYLNTKRLKRKGDRIRITIIVSIFLSLLLCLTLVIFLIPN